MHEKPVICNNTPLVALWSIGYLNLLRDLFGEILIPLAVQKELSLTLVALLPYTEWMNQTGLDLPEKL